MNDYQRYAIYWTPEANSPLFVWGSHWLGWCADQGIPCPQPRVPGLPRPIDELTATPRRYGFHATLKPPFRLAEGGSRWSLAEALEDFAGRTPAFSAPRLELAALDGFLALRPSAAAPKLDALASSCVREFDRFRAPPTREELKRRRAAGLDAVEARHLERWGYPYVMDRFRFHLTLTGSLDAADAERTAQALAPQLAALTASPLTIREIALFGDPGNGHPFCLLERYALTGESRSRNVATLAASGPSLLITATS